MPETETFTEVIARRSASPTAGGSVVTLTMRRRRRVTLPLLVFWIRGRNDSVPKAPTVEFGVFALGSRKRFMLAEFATVLSSSKIPMVESRRIGEPFVGVVPLFSGPGA